MLRQTVLPFCLLAALAFAPSAHAGDRAASVPRPEARPEAQPEAQDEPDNSLPVPFAGYDVGYDYVIAHDHVDVDPYYNYQGPAPTDPRAREQAGLRDGELPITPRTSYYAGVRLYGTDYGYGYSSGYGYGYDACGCAHYRRRYTVYSDDYGHRGASYPGYDNRRREDDGRGYGDR